MQEEQITTTWPCASGRHHLCRGTVLSLTAAHGRPCACPCHSEAQGRAA